MITDTYTDLPLPHGDAVRDGRHLMNGEYRAEVRAAKLWEYDEALSVLLGVPV